MIQEQVLNLKEHEIVVDMEEISCYIILCFEIMKLCLTRMGYVFEIWHPRN